MDAGILRSNTSALEHFLARPDDLARAGVATITNLLVVVTGRARYIFGRPKAKRT